MQTPRQPHVGGQEWKAVRRWVARQDGNLDPKVPARNISDSYAELPQGIHPSARVIIITK